MWLVYAFGSAIAAGITAILAKIGIKRINSNLATALRTIIVVLFAWLMVFVTGAMRSVSQITVRSFLFLLLSGVATGASWLCYFKALQLGEVNKVAPIDKSSTILTMLLAFMILGEAFTWIKIVCMVMMGIGTILMSHQKAIGKQKDDSENRKWLLYAMGSAIFASLTSIFGKIGIQEIDSTLGTAIRTVVVLLMAWIVVGITHSFQDYRRIDVKSYIFLIFSGITTGVSWLCYYKALQQGPASIVVPIDKLSILITVLFSYLILKEKLNRKSCIGLILITIGTLGLLL